MSAAPVDATAGAVSPESRPAGPGRPGPAGPGKPGNARPPVRTRRRRRWPRFLPRFYSRRSVLGLLWWGSVFLPLVALGLGGGLTWRMEVENEVAQMMRATDAVSGQTLRAMEAGDAVLAAVQARIAGWTWQRIATDPRLPDFTRRVTQATPSITSVFVIAPDGKVVTASALSQPSPERDLAGRAFMRAFPAGSDGAGAFVSPEVIGAPGAPLQVQLARPRLGADGRADGGVLTASFAPERFEAVFAQFAATQGGRFALLSRDGRVLASFPEHAGQAAERITDAAVSGLLRDGGRETRLLREGSLLGGLRLVAAQSIAHYDLMVVHSADPATVRTQWFRHMTLPTLTALAVMVLLGLLTVQAQRRLADERELAAQRNAVAAAERAAALERAETEARLRQVEKIAALGQLSAGVAHDFNNLLQSMMVSADTLSQPGLPPGEVQNIAALILRVCDRGMALTGRMLEFSRRDRLPAVSTDVAHSVRGVGELLARLLGRRYRVAIAPVPEDLRAHCHPAEFESVVINLAVNARDAMPEGGEVGICVDALELAPGQMPRTAAGRYVRVVVRDTGMGMDAETLARAGEAFFTTKDAGKGTGLGLSMARGFARRSGGRLDLASTPGQGTEVTLLLPAD